MRVRSFAAVCLSLLLPLACRTAAPSSGGLPTSGGAELAAVIGAVKEAIVEGEAVEVPGFPPLKSVVVKLQTTVSRAVGGEVKYLVVAAAAGSSAVTSSTLELDMKPPEAAHRVASPRETLKDSLAAAIGLAKFGVAEAAKGQPPLAMKTVSIDLKFAVSVDGSASAGVKLVPLGLQATGKVSRQNVHSVILTFGT